MKKSQHTPVSVSPAYLLSLLRLVKTAAKFQKSYQKINKNKAIVFKKYSKHFFYNGKW
jgi:hypothetical protein